MALGILINRYSFTKMSTIGLGDEAQNNFNNNIKVAVSKLPRGKITRTITQLIDKNMIKIGFTDKRKRSDDYKSGTYVARDNKLYSLTIDMFEIEGDLKSGKKFQELHEIKEDIVLYNSKVDINNMDKIAQLKSKRDSIIDDIVDSVDYIELIKATYNLYIRYLITIIGGNQKQIIKLFDYAKSYFNQVIVEILSNMSITLDSKKLELLSMILDYAFYSEYSEHSDQSIFNAMYKKYGMEKKEMVDFVKRNTKKVRGIESIPITMKEIKIASITNTAFIELIRRTAGRDLYNAMNTDFSTYISVLISSRYQIGSFEDIKPIHPELTSKIEELVSNAKRAIVMVGV